MSPLAQAGLSIALGLLIGLSLGHGGTCSVAAARRLALRGEIGPTLGLLLALGAAGCVALPLAWASDGAARLPTAAAVDWRVFLGGALLGVGAMANGACLLGSLTRLGDGETRLLALPAGLAFGFWAAASVGLAPAAAATRGAFGEPSAAGGLMIVGFLALAIAAIVAIRGTGPAPGRLVPASIALGVFGAVLFLLRPGWSYADILHQRFAATMQLAGATGTGAALATIAGAAMAAVRRGTFRLRSPAPFAVARSFGGGALMAVGAMLVPGGNDALLLAAVPTGVPSGAVAYAVMTATVMLIAVVEAQRPRSRAAVDADTSL